MMADKNQATLSNGIPQFSTLNPIGGQTNYVSQSQPQMLHSAGTDHLLNSNVIQKPSISIANGQLMQQNRNQNWSYEAGSTMSNISRPTGEALLAQQHRQDTSVTAAQQPMTMTTQVSKSSNIYSGHHSEQPKNLYPQTSQSSQPSLTSPIVSDKTPFPQPSLTQLSPSIQPNKQIPLLKPTPLMPNTRPNLLTPGFIPANKATGSGDATQPPVFQKMSKQGPASFQYPASFPSNQLLPSQSCMPLNGPPKSSLPSSPYGKPTTVNSNFSSSVVSPTSMGAGFSPQHKNFTQGVPASDTKPQPFLPQNAQLQTQQPGVPGIPQGYQASQFIQTQQPGVPGIPQGYQTSQLASQQATPTYQKPYGSSRDLGPPPLSGIPSSMPVPRQPNSIGQRLPPPRTIGGGYKQPGINSLSQGIERMSVTQLGFNKLWGTETVDLLQCRNILPPQKVTPPPIRLHQEFMDNVNCSPEIFCCTLNKIPETNSLLQKSRLPLGILIHPFRDLSQLAVIQCSSIVRCRACRTYINPFVYFVDNKRWKCNLCFRVNELPDEFQFDPVSKTYGDPSRRPEIRSSTIEFIAPSEYMLRPPQPAIYLFVLDISRWGCDSGYLETLCSVLLEELDSIPGDSRTQIGFILFDSTIHFFSIAENYNQAHEMIVTDIDDIFLPTPDSLLVNLHENRQLIKDLLREIPKKYAESFDTDAALGPALQAAYKLMSPTGGRITVFQSCLPNKGAGALGVRDDLNQKTKDVRGLGPRTDFYKRLSLDCSTQQVSVDFFLVSSQYSDLATLGGVSQFSGGCIYHFPLFRRINPESNELLTRALRRYLTRKIGFEAVMRIRCSRGLSIHTFHGNFFVRSTDLLSLPNVNPDAGFGMQIAIEDSLSELQCVCFQAAVLYTSAKGERRIRVHTLCLPVSSSLNDILTAADQQAIIGLLGKMAVDRSLKSSLSDAREAFINAAVDILSAFKLVETSGSDNTILAPLNLSLIPLYILALLKSTAFRTDQNTRLDDRVYAMSQMKTLPLRELIQSIHPDLYHVTHLDDKGTGVEFEDKAVAQPARISLSSEHLDSRGAFLLDTPEIIYLLIGKNISTEFLVNIFDVKDIRQIDKTLVELPELENDASEILRHFINYLQAEKAWPAIIKIVTEPNLLASFFVNDKSENALSYYELLHHIKSQLK